MISTLMIFWFCCLLYFVDFSINSLLCRCRTCENVEILKCRQKLLLVEDMRFILKTHMCWNAPIPTFNRKNYIYKMKFENKELQIEGVSPMIKVELGILFENYTKKKDYKIKVIG